MPATQPQARAELTGYQETSLHQHVMEFVAALDARGDKRFSRGSFYPGNRRSSACLAGIRALET